jgi:hypothetical protein
MKNGLYVFLLALLLLGACSVDPVKESAPAVVNTAIHKELPAPDNEFFTKYKEDNELEFRYLEEYFGKLEERQYRKDPMIGDSVNWIQRFKGGISIDHAGADSGTKVRIAFPGYDKAEILKFMKWFCESPDNSWDSGEEKYSPVEGDAGCYYEIGKDTLGYFIDYYCGC